MPANQERGSWVEPRRFLLPFVPKRDRKVFYLINFVGTGVADDGWTQSGGLCGGRLRRPGCGYSSSRRRRLMSVEAELEESLGYTPIQRMRHSAAHVMAEAV